MSPTSPGSTGIPVTIAHKYGRTSIESEPKRIATVGLTDQDAVLALGVVLVGTTEWLGGYRAPSAPGPRTSWAEPRPRPC